MRRDKALDVVATSRALGQEGQAAGVLRWWRNAKYTVNARGMERRIEHFYDDPGDKSA